MNIAIDIDGTYTADPMLWEMFIQAAQSQGHNLWFVTKREPSLGAPSCSLPCIFTSRRAKIPICEAQGIHIDVWIDDSPAGVLFNDDAHMQVSG